MRVLAVNVYQLLTQIAQLRQGHTHTVDKRAALALGVNRATNQECIRFIPTQFLLVQPRGDFL